MQSTEQRALQGHGAHGYAGDVSPLHTWEQLRKDSTAVLIDVRTPEEWALGVPDLTPLGKKLFTISWRFSSPAALNGQFCASVKALGFAADAPLFFLCRSGGRSQDAAIAVTALGFTRCYNIENGFEGPPDDAGQRGTVAGWKAAQLPWRQDE